MGEKKKTSLSDEKKNEVFLLEKEKEPLVDLGERGVIGAPEKEVTKGGGLLGKRKKRKKKKKERARPLGGGKKKENSRFG